MLFEKNIPDTYPVLKPYPNVQRYDLNTRADTRMLCRLLCATSSGRSPSLFLVMGRSCPTGTKLVLHQQGHCCCKEPPPFLPCELTKALICSFKKSGTIGSYDLEMSPACPQVADISSCKEVIGLWSPVTHELEPNVPHNDLLGLNVNELDVLSRVYI